ncbi:D-Ala-D-Ala carboxypeptidase family metallohydrolase [Bacteroides sp.]|uniref:D-Ala-D-Ala carboxypeptidase family metallohydrolase n=1 Tax=Bacteroides sp. TaxID=29523 RepID=UPI0026083049|nr:D-Ala-D-Ala carboxypeptidase family metallohydrolase [Bacteroides sp.]MDD3038599.1 D-Ala-D-Ala carboxypeptidase family metallohydrolase [Bacteroides sp.]
MKHFTLKELCRSNVAEVRRIDNKPNQQQIDSLTALVDNVLDPLRERFKRPIIINSGFRSKDLNGAVGGAYNSQHMKGEAADIYAGTKEGNRELFELIRKHLPFDQLINENDFSWIHVSYRADGKNNRGEMLKL